MPISALGVGKGTGVERDEGGGEEEERNEGGQYFGTTAIEYDGSKNVKEKGNRTKSSKGTKTPRAGNGRYPNMVSHGRRTHTPHPRTRTIMSVLAGTLTISQDENGNQQS